MIFRILPRDVAGVAFEYLPLDQQTEIVQTLGSEQLKNVLNEMAPDDRTRLFEELPAEVTKRALEQLSRRRAAGRAHAAGLPGRHRRPLHDAGVPRAEARDDRGWRDSSAVRKHGKGRETLNLLYLVDEKSILLADLRLAELVMAAPDARVGDLPTRPLVAIPATASKDEIISTFEKYDRVALPVTDSRGAMLGIITADDVLDVAEEQATEDIQKMGGMEALDAPYMEISALRDAAQARRLALGAAGGRDAHHHRDDALRGGDREGGGAGALRAADHLVGRQLAAARRRRSSSARWRVGEIDVKDWWKVLLRELRSGADARPAAGRRSAWRASSPGKRLHTAGVISTLVRRRTTCWSAMTVAMSLMGVVLFGSVTGSMLPFMLRRLGFDPATASAPLVATLVDVTGIIIYFTAATLLLGSTLLAH